MAEGHRWASPTRTTAFVASALVAASVAFAVFLTDRYVQQHRTALDHAFQKELRDDVGAVAYNFELAMEGVTAMHSLGRTISALRVNEELPAVGPLNDYAQSIAANRLFGAVQLALITRDGRLAWSTVPGFTTVDLSDREHFRTHRAGRQAPFVSEPLIGRASNRLSIQFTRPVFQLDGGFGGVVVASIDPLELSARLRALLHSRSIDVQLLRRNGTIIAATVDPERMIGKTMPLELLGRIEAALAAAPSATWSFLKEDPAGTNALIAGRLIPEWDILVVLAENYTNVAEEVHRLRQSILKRLGTGLGFVVLAALLTAALLSRRRARQAAMVAESIARDRNALLNSLPGAAYRAFVGLDGSLRRLDASASMLSLLRHHAAESPEIQAADLTAIWRRICSRTMLLEVLRNGEGMAEYSAPAPNGAHHWLRDRARVTRVHPDGDTEIVGILSDISAEREVEAKAIVGAKLAMLGEMTTGIAHELGQPLAAITLAADSAALLLEASEAKDVSRARDILESISVQTMRMRVLIDHFRNFARGDDAAPAVFDVATAIDGAFSIACGALHASGTRLKADIAERLPKVRGQQLSLEQVLVNLLMNADFAMDQNMPESRVVHVSAAYEATQDRVRITVRDFGTGIAPEHLSRVFEPFFTTKPVGRGTGLGLSIAHGLVSAMGGTIEISNHPGGGALATISLQPTSI